MSNANEYEVLESQEHVYQVVEEYLNGVRPPPEAQSNMLWDFLKQLKPTSNLFATSFPSFVIQPCSLLEKLSSFCTPHPDLLQTHSLPTPELRFLNICKWFLSIHRQTSTQKSYVGSKPFNPVLGEQFYCSWENPDPNNGVSGEGDSIFIGEQVSHHPPISAFYFRNNKYNLVHTGFVKPCISWKGLSLEHYNEGEQSLYICNHDEKYVLQLAPVLLTGLVWGPPTISLSGKMRISCPKTDYSASITFGSKKEEITVDGKIRLGKKDICKLSGDLMGTIIIKDLRTKEERIFYRSQDIPILNKKVDPLTAQQPFHSRRVWHKATYELIQLNYDRATEEKKAVEEKQREIARSRKDGNDDEFEPRLFHAEGNSWVYNGFNTDPHRPEQM